MSNYEFKVWLLGIVMAIPVAVLIIEATGWQPFIVGLVCGIFGNLLAREFIDEN